MVPDEPRFLTGDRWSFTPHIDEPGFRHTPYCWGCGPEAVHGLGMQARFDGTDVVADLEFPEHFQGGPGVVHGGAIAAFVDDLLGYVPVVFGSPGVTASLEIHYRRPIPLGVVVEGRAWLSRVDGRKMWAEGTVRTGGVLLVEATALFVAIGPEHFQDVGSRLEGDRLARESTYRSGDYYP